MSSRSRSCSLVVVLALGAAVVGPGCGGDEPEVDGAAATSSSTATVDDGGGAGAGDGTTTATTGADDELPPPDEGDLLGTNRLVNLLIEDGEPVGAVDVWAQATFTNGAALLAEGVGFGEVSDVFGAPEGAAVVVVGAGDDPDAADAVGILTARDDEVVLAHLAADDTGERVVSTFYEEGDAGFGAIGLPEPGSTTGRVAINALAIRPFTDTIPVPSGSPSDDPTAYNVAIEGEATCAHQAVEDEGFARSILGGTQIVVVEVAPGPAAIALHASASDRDCTGTPALPPIAIDVAGAAAQWVLLFTPDGESVDSVSFPFVGSAG